MLLDIFRILTMREGNVQLLPYQVEKTDRYLSDRYTKKSSRIYYIWNLKVQVMSSGTWSSLAHLKFALKISN